jgi:hypothetical protein
MDSKFKLEDRVKKQGDYEYSGIIVSVFTNRAGAIRYVVEADRTGILNICAEEQLELRDWRHVQKEATRPTLWGRAGRLDQSVLAGNGETLPQSSVALVARTTHVPPKGKARRHQGFGGAQAHGPPPDTSPPGKRCQKLKVAQAIPLTVVLTLAYPMTVMIPTQLSRLALY